MKKHWGLLTTLLLLGISTGSLSAQIKEEAIAGYVGQNIIVPIENPDSASIDRRDVVTYLDPLPEGEQRVILSALKPGVARVTLVKNNQTSVYTIAITDPNEDDRAKTIKDMVGQPGLDVRFVGGVIVLQGEVEDDIYLKKAVNLANAYSPTVLNYVSVQRPLQVRIKVQVVSVDLTNNSNIGVQYGPLNAQGTGLAVPFGFYNGGKSKFPFFDTQNLAGGGGVGMPIPQFPQFAVFGQDINATMNLAQNYGKVKVLQEPTLTVLNGQSSVFRVGGEFPVLTRTFDDNGNTTVTADYRPFGISLLVTPLVEETEGINPIFSGREADQGTQPIQTFGMRESPNLPMTVNQTIDRNGIIKMFVRPEISTLDYSRVDADPINNPFPNINQRLVETRVAMKNRESLVLGGLFDENMQESMSSVPFISKIPVFGELFKNRVKDGTKRELAFILTPEIIGREIMQAGDKLQPRLSEMAKQLEYANEKSAANPVKISASEVMIRTAEYVPDNEVNPAPVPAKTTAKKAPAINPPSPAVKKTEASSTADNNPAVPLSSSIGELPR